MQNKKTIPLGLRNAFSTLYVHKMISVLGFTKHNEGENDISKDKSDLI